MGLPKPTSDPSLPARTQPRSTRYQCLDIWRGIACLMIVALHASFFSDRHESGTIRFGDSVGDSLLYVVSRMGIGVQLFFVISGYCIAATADSARRKPRGILQYFKRRFRRIFPPYWAALTLTILAVLFASCIGRASLFTEGNSPIPHPKTLTPLQWLGNVTLTETWRGRVIPTDSMLMQIGPAWSLCYEEQFYAVCGLLLLLSRRWFFVSCSVVSLATILLLPWTVLRAETSLAGFFFDGMWLLFAAGVLAYYQIHYTTGKAARAWLAAMVLAFVASLLLRYGIVSASGGFVQKDRSFQLVAGLCFALLLVILHRWDKLLSGLMIFKPLAFCGTMCYSLYLIHWPIARAVSYGLASKGVTGVWPTILLTIPSVTILSIGAAWAFYSLVERRFLNSPFQEEASRIVPDIPGKPGLARKQLAGY